MGAGEIAHVLDHPDDRHARLAEELPRARGVQEREILRRHHEHRVHIRPREQRTRLRGGKRRRRPRFLQLLDHGR